ncbi:CaiB/BaiF CoA-transferase family protein [Bosea sp. (in: a-proteobacteria)]|uniref:CaiB/BaiF CoA transferase family protein n=1 Tax=Bosea sp. (in: a-proteobacteria) TaxID=1871050 RepID=UPI002610049A|nr:CoA transferase [Bosea sp. (in: a-proteobacteria)]MCO5089529.1 CoA transferase [Bosea sp. (in: a-proteobacteria)]
MQWSDGAPLAGIRVLDLCRVVSGPFATMLLGDLGADVLKVEEPRNGDESRTYGPPFVGGESAYFLSVNRNKRSCAVDLKSQTGRDLVLRLARVADVVIENFRPGTMERLGLGFDTLRQGNERLLYCGISGFGRTGPEAGRPGYDLILQGESGVMDITGDADGPPTKVGTSIADLVTGLYAAQAVLAGLAQRQRTGTGGRVDVSMLDSMASLLTFNAGMYFASGRSPKRRGNAHPTISPYETFRAADGWFNLGVANDRFWAAFCKAMARPDLLAEPRYARAADRAALRAELKAILEPVFREKPRGHWTALFIAAGIPCGAIKSVGEVCEEPQLAARGVARSMHHPAAGDLRYLASAVRFDDEPPPDARRPPLLGEHNGEILAEWLSMDEAQIAGLACSGAFGETSAGGKENA